MERLSPKRILVTGATGFIGGKLVEYLAQFPEKYHPIATGRNPQKASFLQKRNITFIMGDLSDGDFVREICKDVDVIVHCAAKSTPWGTFEEFYEANALPTFHIVQACKSMGMDKAPLLINISTSSIYADYKNHYNIKENYLPETFINDYASTKYKSDIYVREASRLGLRTITLRPRAVYGAGDTTVFPRLIKAYQQKKLPIIGNGENIASLTTVQNLIHAIELSINASPDAYGEVYNIANENPDRLWDVIRFVFELLDLDWKPIKVPYWILDKTAHLAERVASAHPKQPEPTLTRYSVAAMHFSMTLNIDKAKEKLGYTPQQTTNDGLLEFVEDYVHRKNQ